MNITDETLIGLDKLLDPTGVIKRTKKELEEALKKIIELVRKISENNARELDRIISTFGSLKDKLNSDTSAAIAKTERTVSAELDSLLRRFASEQKKIDDRLAQIQDGKPADEIRIVGDVLAQLPKLQEIVDETIRQIPKQEEKIFEIKDIKNLQEELDRLRKLKQPTFFSGGGGVSKHNVAVHDLSASLNGVLKTFSLPAFWKIIDVKLSSVPVLRLTTDYTADGSAHTITFTSEVNAATDLASGQSCIVIYSE